MTELDDIKLRTAKRWRERVTWGNQPPTQTERDAETLLQIVSRVERVASLWLDIAKDTREHSRRVNHPEISPQLDASAEAFTERALQIAEALSATSAQLSPTARPHEHEQWQLRDVPDGGTYCAACGQTVTRG